VRQVALTFVVAAASLTAWAVTHVGPFLSLGVIAGVVTWTSLPTSTPPPPPEPTAHSAQRPAGAGEKDAN
jgi:hypothetical protein